ncbi:CRISPR-associated protein [compost metagenome]
MERILPCIVDQRQIPLDIVRSAVQRASNPVGMEEWEWQKTLSIACALVNKHYAKEGYGLYLKAESTDRSYLFGRLLAVADVLEERELNREKKRSGSSSHRATNAVRYMNVFSHRPLRTWKIIYAQIQPYLVRMGDKSFFYNKLCQEIMGKFELQQFNDEPLTGLFLMGYYNQRDEMYTSKQAKEAGQANSSQEALQDPPDTVTDDHSE